MRLKPPLLLLTACLAVASAPAFAQQQDLSAEYAKCIEQSGGTDPGMLDCMGAEEKRQDKRLNDAYKFEPAFETHASPATAYRRNLPGIGSRLDRESPIRIRAQSATIPVAWPTH